MHILMSEVVGTPVWESHETSNNKNSDVSPDVFHAFADFDGCRCLFLPDFSSSAM